MEPLTPEPPVGPRAEIDEATIRALVDAFYAKVRRDPQLGPVFERAIGDGWEPHLATMYRFWSAVMLRTGAYKGNPLAVHQRVEGMAPELFARWLALFDETARDVCDEPLAEAFSAKARNIAESLRLGLFYRPGADGLRVLARPPERNAG